MLRQNSRLSAINPALKSQAPIFNRSTTAPQIKLEELFGGASPEQMKPGSSSLALPPPKLFIGNEDGSPIAPLNRQPRLNPHRPKGKVRRTHSMFEKPKEVMRDDDLRKSLVKMPINPSPRADPGESSYLPCFTVKDDPLRRINKATLCEVMDGTYENHYDEYLIVDCRFEYEYEGGHIEGAINVNSIDTLEDKFFSEPREKRHLIIFHCEYSAHRAPRM